MKEGSQKKGSQHKYSGSRAYSINTARLRGEGRSTQIRRSNLKLFSTNFTVYLNSITSRKGYELLRLTGRLWKNSVYIFTSYPLSTASSQLETLLKDYQSLLQKYLLTDEYELHITSLEQRQVGGR